jgi:hypothetical protein
MRRTCLVLCAVAALLVPAAAQTAQPRKPRNSPPGYTDTPVLPGQQWKVHDLARPHPKLIDPGTASTQEQAGRPPADAIVLFDGKDISHWLTNPPRSSPPGTPPVPARWKVERGYMEIVPGSGTAFSKETFGTAQYHLEWSVPPGLADAGQWRGNSGVLLMGLYEIQVLESFDNPTYADGQAASIYGQFPPLVNASRKPGEWQTYDIIFEAPVFTGDKLTKPAFVTVLHNGILVHHRQEIIGRMAHRVVGTYAPHPPEAPLALQDHDVPVRYRNIWVRPLKGYDQP